MEVVFMIFMTFVSLMALFAVAVVVRDVVRESYANRRINDAAEREREAAMREAILAALEAERASGVARAETAEAVAPAAEVAPVEVMPVAEAPVEEEATEEETAEEEPTEEDAEGKVSFAAAQKQSLDEQYAALTVEQKGFYDRIAAYAAAKEGSKCNKNLRYEEYKMGSKRIVRLRIKRGIVHCEFMMINRDFRNHINENKIAVKEAATIIKVQNAATVEAVLGSIDLAIQLIEEERAYKKQLARERRKLAYRQSKN